jgi:hypothetical protein
MSAIPSPARKTLDAESEILEHCFDEILAPLERGDQKTLFIWTAISGTPL